MLVARFEMPDGRVARFSVPDGTSPEQAQAMIEKELAGLGQKVSETQPDTADLIAGNPLTRFALGAASPALGLVQLGSELLGSTAVTEHLKRLEEMKRRGSTPAAELELLKRRRAGFARIGNEPAVKAIDKQIAELGTSPSANPNDAGIDFAGIAGTILSPAVLGAMKIPAAASVLGRAGQGSAIGASFGAATPVTGGGDFAETKAAQIGTGALIGGVIPPAIDATRKVYQVGRNILDPLLPGGAERGAARIIAETAGPKRAAIEAELAKDQVFVPGSQPTAAEAAARAGSPELSALQKIAEAHKPSAYSDIGKTQEAARLGSVQSFGKDKAAVEAAQGARGAVAEFNYGAVRNSLIKMDNEVGRLLSRPSMGKALSRAKELAEEAGENFQIGVNRPAQAVPSAIVNVSGKPAMTTIIPEEVAKYPVQSLHYVKMAMDDMISTPERFGIGASEVRAIGQTRKMFLAWLENRAPQYEKARTTYAAMSKPVNEMQVGQELERALVKPIGEGERAGVFGGAMREAPRTIKKATGQPRFDELEDVLSPENLSKAKSVLADLARKAEFDRLAPLGRGKAAEAAQPFGLPATGPLQQSYMIFKTILGRVSKGINEKTLDTMADALQLPSSTLKLLQHAPTEKQAALIDRIIAMKLGRGAIAAGTQLSAEGMQQ